MMTFSLGNELLKKNVQDIVKGKRIGFVGNHTSVFADGSRVVNFLKIHAEKIVLFGPEHSFCGDVEDQKEVDSDVQEDGTPVYSLFGEFETPTEKMCSSVDIFIYDIQSVGVRFYTFLTTLYNVMEACRMYNKSLFVCDRPNIISGDDETISGPVTRPNCCSFFSCIPLPVRHGMTIGELSNLFNNEYVGCFPPMRMNLKILRMENYSRSSYFPSLKMIQWIPCSPCIPEFATTMLYPGFCFFEGSNVSEGRGTTKPFQIIGAPWMKLSGKKLSEVFYSKLEEYEKNVMAGITVKDVEFIPLSLSSCSKPKYLREKCYGFEFGIRKGISDKELSRIKPVKFALFTMCKIREYFGGIFKLNKFVDGLFGSEYLRSTLMDKSFSILDFKKICSFSELGVDCFSRIRKKYILYQ